MRILKKKLGDEMGNKGWVYKWGCEEGEKYKAIAF